VSAKFTFMEKLAVVTIHVPYKSAGNVIRQKEVCFEVYQANEGYSIKPVLTEPERRLANLPERLGFHLAKGKAVSDRGARDGNLHVIQDVVTKLKEQRLVV
jgi:hypothetical protein